VEHDGELRDDRLTERPTTERDRFRAYRESGTRDQRNRLVEEHIGVAEYVARRFANRGEPFEDLRQVALIALVKAVERFDPERGVAFVGFAVPTITGEIKRHFRDRTWSVRVPRALQERSRAIETARDELGHALGRSPTVGELAGALDLSEEEILDGLEARAVYRSASLDEPLPGTGVALRDLVADHGDGFARAEDRCLLERLLDRLPPRERRIVHLRYFDGLTQAEIGQRLGISQMHVSRLLGRSIATLSRLAGADPADAAEPADRR